MRRPFTLSSLLVVLLLSSLSVAEARRQAVSKAEEEVRKVEREWLDAYEKFDADAMDRIVAEDFTITFPNSQVQRKPQLMAQTRAQRSAAPPPVTRIRTEQVESRAYGDTVILMGVVISEYERDGKTTTMRFRYTDTYVRHDGRWQVVASHLSNVAEKKQ